MTHQRDLALSARSFLRPVTSRRIPLNPDLGYWGGVNYAAQATITNGAGAAGTHNYDVVPGEGNEFEVIGGLIHNGTTQTRNGFVSIRDALGGNDLTGLLWTAGAAVGMGANQRFSFPTATQTLVVLMVSRPLLVAGMMSLHARIEGIAVNQDTGFGVILRVRGDKPILTLSSPAGATEVINTDEFF